MKAWLFGDDERNLVRSPVLMNSSTLLHFGAELAYTPAILIPIIKNWHNPNFNEIYCYVGGAVVLNAVCQPLAFYTKARAMTSEANYDLAKLFAHNCNIAKRKKGLGLAALLEKSLCKLHMHFARKYGQGR